MAAPAVPRPGGGGPGEPGDRLPESGLEGVRETFGLFPTFGQNLGLNVSLSISNEDSSSRIHRPKGLPRVPESPDTMSRTLHTSGVCIFLRLSAAFCEVGGPSATVGWLVTAPPAATLGPEGGFAAAPWGSLSASHGGPLPRSHLLQVR